MNEIRLPESAYRSLLGLNTLMHACRSISALQICLTEHLADVIWADLVTLNTIDIIGHMGGSIGRFSPEFVSPKEIEPFFDRYVNQHPLVQQMAATGDGRPRRMSDFIDMDEFRQLELYKYVFKPLRSLHQIAFMVNSIPGLVVGIGINRTTEDFTEEELAISGLVYEQIAPAFHHVQLTEVHEREKQLKSAQDLTDRERDILVYIRAGMTNQEIATALMLARRTIEKHLERIYLKLGVTNRTAAISAVWPPQ